MVQLANYYRYGALAASTHRTYDAGVRSYIQFTSTQLQLNEEQIWPPTEAAIEQWLAWLAGIRARSYQTICNYLIGLNTRTLDKGYQLITANSYRINRTLEGIKRRTGIKPRLIRRPLTTTILREHIAPILPATAYRSYEECLIWAALCTGTYGLMRAGEISQTPAAKSANLKPLCLANLSAWNQQGKSIQLNSFNIQSSYYFIIHLPQSKADRYRKGVNVTISNTIAVQSLIAYVQRHPQINSNSLDSPLFINQDSSPLSVVQLVIEMRKLLERAGINEAHEYYGHSMRKGGAQSLRELPNITNEQIKVAGRWSSNAHEAYHTTPLNEHIILNQRL